MTKGDIYGYAIAAGTARFAFRDGLIAAGSDGFSPDQVEKEKQYKEMLQFYKDMAPYMPKAQVTWAYPEMFTAFCDGRVGMIANGNYFSSNVFSINPEIIKVSRVIPFPRGPSASSAKGGSLVSSAGYAMVKGGKNKEAAWNILKLIADTDMAARSAAGINITAHLDVTTAMLKPYAQNIYPGVIDEHLKLVDAWSKIADSAGVAMPKIMGQSQMEPVFQKQLLDLIAGSISVDQASLWLIARERINGLPKRIYSRVEKKQNPLFAGLAGGFVYSGFSVLSFIGYPALEFYQFKFADPRHRKICRLAELY